MTVLGKVLPLHKLVQYALVDLFGLNLSMASVVCAHWGIGLNRRVADLPKNVRTQMLQDFENGLVVLDPVSGTRKSVRIEKELRRSVLHHISRLGSMACYRGIRYKAGLPCHGQRTRTNGSKRRRVNKKGKILS